MSFWENKKVLITGASGFIGSHLAKKVVSQKSKVVTLSPHATTIEGTIPKIGSVENFELLNNLIKKEQIQIIFHLAAQPIVEVGQTNPINTFEVNIKGTWNILEAARENNIQKIIVASTVHVYGDNPDLPYKEEYFPQPSRPYETSKACADLLAQSFADTYDLPVEIPRFVNIYGPGDLNFTRLIPKVIKTVLKGENPHVWDIGSVRDFLYIDDAIDAYLTLAQKQVDNKKRLRVVNFGAGKPIKVYDLVLKIINLIDKNMKIKTEATPDSRFNEIKQQYVSIEKAKKELNWEPKINLDEGLEKTIEWYKNNSRLFL